MDRSSGTHRSNSPEAETRGRIIRLNSLPFRIIAILVVVAGTGAMFYYLWWFFLAAWITRGKTMDPAIYERAVKYDPKNAEYHYFLAQIYNYSTQYLNMQRAREEYELAVHYNPNRSQYWQDLSRFYEQIGDIARSREAMAKTLENDPNYALRHWAAANLYVRLGDQKAADAELRRAADLDPAYTIQVLDLVWAVYGDPDFVISSHVPNTREGNLVALNFFVDHGSAQGAAIAWQRSKTFTIGQQDLFRYVEYLIRESHPHEAWDVFTYGMKTAPAFYNGSFENDPINWGFDWHAASSDDAEVRRDTTTVKEGLASLLLNFTGKKNPDYSEVWHYLPVRQGHTYALTFWMKTDSISSSEGVYVNVDGAASEKQVGTTYWRQFNIPFTASSDLVRVAVRRDASRKFDNVLKGKVWVDDFNITEIR